MQLDKESLCTPLAADFGPCLARRRRRRGARLDGELICGAQLDRGLLSLPLADFGPGPEGRRRGAQLDGEFAVYASRCRLASCSGRASLCRDRMTASTPTSIALQAALAR